MTTANKITVIRILMIPAFVTMAIYYGESIERGEPLEWQRFTAIIIFLVAAVSDGLDGYVARRYNQRSALGVILDPIADKGLLLSGIITLASVIEPSRSGIWAVSDMVSCARDHSRCRNSRRQRGVAFAQRKGAGQTNMDG
jgi:CDP-diacylglycerol--glycerol-3-phosphate 3-phosphatidyltransferase